jgi:hypothetical protein
MNQNAGEYIEFFGDTDSVMKEYAFLPASQLDPLRDQFLPSKVAKKLQCCIEGARKEKLEINSVIEVRSCSVVLCCVVHCCDVQSTCLLCCGVV